MVTMNAYFFSVKRQCEEKEQRLAVLEESFASTQKEVTELRSCLREVERSRLEARRELQELRRQVCTPLHITALNFITTERFRMILGNVVYLAAAEDSRWRKGAERKRGGGAADASAGGGAEGGGKGERAVHP